MTSKRRARFLIVALVATAVASVDAAGTLRVTSVERVGGRVRVTGTADLGARPPAATPQAAQLVADAGGSAYVAAGEPATLLGSAYGGRAPYRFSWKAGAGRIRGADAPTAQLDTKGLKPGVYAVALTVTDAAGARAADTVKLAVYGATSRTILDDKRTDTTPGASNSSALEIPFTVPAGVSRIDIVVSWDTPEDYDLRVLDPAGKNRGSSGEVPGMPESYTVADPQAGAWKIALDRYAVVGVATVSSVVTAHLRAGDPRPAVDAGGPYRFPVGGAQRLVATVKGGKAPLRSGWDTDGDGRIDAPGAAVTVRLPEGRHLVTFSTTDARGFERRQTTSVLVAAADRLALDTSAITVISIADTGINPYHLEFGAETFPDPEVLAVTRNFTRHPSEYIPGYPADAPALPVTLGEGYLPDKDRPIWDGTKTITPGRLYWIPGTKIVGAVATSGGDPHPILDDNGHGDGSASVAAGNRYGYCPTCLLVVIEGLDETVATRFPWVDIGSHSYGYTGGLPAGLATGPNTATRDAVERGQTILFAAGNGVGNTFDAPQVTYGSDQDGAPWNVTVGAVRRDNKRGIFGDGIPSHISSWGDGNLPSACRTGTVGQCAFGGTSAASPYTAGIFGTVLSEVRRALGDVRAGQKPGQVVAQGAPIKASPYLADGKLTRAELRDAVLKTAEPLNKDNRPSTFPNPVTPPYAPMTNVLVEGYGVATPDSAKRAVDVLLGRAPLPDRSFEDSFFALDRSIREAIYGRWDSNGDGTRESSAPEGLDISLADVSTLPAVVRTFQKAAALQSAAATAPDGRSALTYFLHRRFSDPTKTPSTALPAPAAGVPDTTVGACHEEDNEFTMDTSDTGGDLEPCFNTRTTSVVAAYRPVAIWPTSSVLEETLPAGSTVEVELYAAAEVPSVVRPTGVLVATDREIGVGAAATPLPVVGSGTNGAACATLGESCWTRFSWSFQTIRPAFAGEQITFQAQIVGARSWAFGYEGAHASKIRISPADGDAGGFGVTISRTVRSGVVTGTFRFPDQGADPESGGDHPSIRRVEVSVGDAAFGNPIAARLDEAKRSWSVALGSRASGTHRVYARALVDRRTSPVSSALLTLDPDAVIEWQVVAAGRQPAASGWRPAEGVARWTFTYDPHTAGPGSNTIHVRARMGRVEVARVRTAGPISRAALPATGIPGGAAGLALVAAALGLAVAFGVRQKRDAA